MQSFQIFEIEKIAQVVFFQSIPYLFYIFKKL